MAHSNQIREFLLTDKGIDLLDVYVGSGGVLTGSARLAREAEEKANSVLRQDEIEALELDLERKRRMAKSQIENLQAGLEADEAEIRRRMNEAKLRQKVLAEEMVDMAKLRKADEKISKK